MNGIIRKWSGLSDAVKASASFAVSSFVVKGISFLTTPIVTRILNTEQYGIVTTYNSWKTIIEVFALLGLTSVGVFNVGLKDHSEYHDRNSYISTTLNLCNLCTVFVFFVLIIIYKSVGSGLGLSWSLIIAMFINLLFSPAQFFWLTRQRYEYKYKCAFLITMLSAFFSQIISICCILKYKNAENISLAELRVWSTVIPQLIFQIPIYCILQSRGKSFISISTWKSTLMFAIPLLPHYLAQHIMSASDRIMIANYYSVTGAAIYGVVSNISLICGILWNAVNGSLIPYVYESIKNRNLRKTPQIVSTILSIYALMCIAITLCAPEILCFLAPSNYYSGVYAIPPITATVFINSMYNLYANVEFYYKKASWISLSTVIATIVNVALNFLLIPQYGFVAAAYTTLISHIVLVALHYIGYRKCAEYVVYNDRMIFILFIGCIVISLVCGLLYSNIYIRYGTFVLLLIFGVAFRETIKMTLKEIKKK